MNSTTVLQYLLLYYSTTVLQYYSTTVLQYYSTTVLQYYSTVSEMAADVSDEPWDGSEPLPHTVSSAVPLSSTLSSHSQTESSSSPQETAGKLSSLLPYSGVIFVLSKSQFIEWSCPTLVNLLTIRTDGIVPSYYWSVAEKLTFGSLLDEYEWLIPVTLQ